MKNVQDQIVHISIFQIGRDIHMKRIHMIIMIWIQELGNQKPKIFMSFKIQKIEYFKKKIDLKIKQLEEV